MASSIPIAAWCMPRRGPARFVGVGRAGGERNGGGGEAPERDGADRVRRGHERRVEERGHARDHLEADEPGQDEDVELDEGCAVHGGSYFFRTSPACVTALAAGT